MGNAPAAFRKVDLARAAKVAASMGEDWRARVLTDGSIVVERGPKIEEAADVMPRRRVAAREIPAL